MVAVLVVALVVLGVFVVRAFMKGSGSGEAGLGTTTSGRPANSIGTTDKIPDKPTVEISKSDYLDMPSDEAVEKLSGYGLQPETHTQQGGVPQDKKKCLVSEVSPAGEVAIGSRVQVICVPT